MATLAYDYGQRCAWLGPLADEPSPATHDLCAEHADRMSVPIGWTLDDRRRPHALPLEAPAA